MNKNTKPQASEKKAQVDYYKVMMEKFHSYLDAKTPTQLKSALFKWGALAVILIGVSVVPIPEELNVLSALVGTPAGIILWFILAALFRETKLSDSWLAGLKDRYSHARRRRAVFIGLALLVIGGIFVSSWMPYGIGGVVSILVAMFCFYFLSKTDEEKTLDQYGLPDPRDYGEFYDELEEGEFDDIEGTDSQK